MKVTARSDYVWMPSNHFNLHLSSQGKLIHKSRAHLSSVPFFLSSACMCNHTPLTGELLWARTAVIHASGDMLSPLARSAVSRHQVVSRQSAGMQMCPQQRFNCYDSPICHRICSLPTALGLKLVSVQDILAVWWIHPLPALSSPAFRSKGLLPPAVAPPRPSHLYASVLYFSRRGISQQDGAQQGPKPRL